MVDEKSLAAYKGLINAYRLYTRPVLQSAVKLRVEHRDESCSDGRRLPPAEGRAAIGSNASYALNSATRTRNRDPRSVLERGDKKNSGNRKPKRNEHQRICSAMSQTILETQACYSPANDY